MRDIINLITEAVKPDPEILDELRHKYTEFNEAYYEGKLPNIPIKWANLKNAGAQVAFSTITHGGKKYLMPETVVMQISAKYVRTVNDIIPILLHEMCHVWVMFIDGDVVEHHGKNFFNILKIVSQRSGIDIPLTDTVKGKELLDKSVKPVGVIFRRDYTGAPSFALISPNTLKAKLPDLIKRYSGRFSGLKDEIKALIVTSPRWTEKASRMPLQRVVDYKVKFYSPTDEDMADLFANSELLWEKIREPE
jgi:hypothetical protein